MDDDCESRLSKLVPYGLLSSSFHMFKGIRKNRDGRCRPTSLQSLFRAVKLEPGKSSGLLADESFKCRSLLAGEGQAWV